MAENNSDPFSEAARQFSDGQNQFLKMWNDFAGKMTSAGMSFSPDSTPPDMAKQMRSTFFKAWSDYCDNYMRSPEFLESWKKAMDGAIEWRRQMNETMGRMHHEFQGTSRQDIDHLMQTLTHIERRIVDTQERSSERIEELAARVEALEASLAPAKPKRKKATKKKTAKKSKGGAKRS